MVVGGERERASSLLRFLGSATDSFAGVCAVVFVAPPWPVVPPQKDFRVSRKRHDEDGREEKVSGFL